MTIQLCYASTLYGAATMAAAIADGALGDADRRILLCSSNVALPEVTATLQDTAGFAAVATHFDEVRSLNATLFPLHPGAWSPREGELPVWERLLRSAWGLGAENVALVVESVQVNPARALCRVFADAAIEVYADGLMSYGPTRSVLPAAVGARIERLHFLELVPGLTPLLLREWDVAPVPVSRDAFRTVLDAITELSPAPPTADGPVALLLGQYLSALGLITTAEEEQLHVDLLRAAVRHGHRRVVVKPHPTAADALLEPLRAEAERLGVQVEVIDTPMLAEALFARLPVALVLGCFSTALFTASWLYDLPTGRVGTAAVLDRLTPYENSNRIPVILVHAWLPDLSGPAERRPDPSRVRGPDGIDGLVQAVGYAMQPRALADRRVDVEGFLSRNRGWARPYFTRRRLTRLALPGGRPPPTLLGSRVLRRRLGIAYREGKRRAAGAGRALRGRTD